MRAKQATEPEYLAESQLAVEARKPRPEPGEPFFLTIAGWLATG